LLSTQESDFSLLEGCRGGLFVVVVVVVDVVVGVGVSAAFAHPSSS